MVSMPYHTHLHLHASSPRSPPKMSLEANILINGTYTNHSLHLDPVINCLTWLSASSGNSHTTSIFVSLPSAYHSVLPAAGVQSILLSMIKGHGALWHK